MRLAEETEKLKDFMNNKVKRPRPDYVVAFFTQNPNGFGGLFLIFYCLSSNINK